MVFSTTTTVRQRTSSIQSTPWVQSGFVSALRQNAGGRGSNDGRTISCLRPRLFTIVSACFVLVQLRWTAVYIRGNLGGAQPSPSGLVLEDKKKYGGVAIAKEQAKGRKASDRAEAKKMASGGGTLVTLDGVSYEFCRECLYHRNVGSCEVRAKWMMKAHSISMEEAMQGAIKQVKGCGKAVTKKMVRGEKNSRRVAIAKEQAKGKRASDRAEAKKLASGGGTLVTLDGVNYEFCRECLYHRNVGSCEVRAKWVMKTRSISMEEAMQDAIKQVKECGKAVAKKTASGEKKDGGVAIAKEQGKGRKTSDRAEAKKLASGGGKLVNLDGVNYEFCRECLYHRNVGSCEVRAKWVMKARSISMEEAMQDAIKQVKECGKESKGLVTVDGVSYKFCPECEFKGKDISCQQRVDWMVNAYNTPLNTAMESAMRQKRECGKAQSN